MVHTAGATGAGTGKGDALPAGKHAATVFSAATTLTQPGAAAADPQAVEEPKIDKRRQPREKKVKPTGDAAVLGELFIKSSLGENAEFIAALARYTVKVTEARHHAGFTLTITPPSRTSEITRADRDFILSSLGLQFEPGRMTVNARPFSILVPNTPGLRLNVRVQVADAKEIILNAAAAGL